jgi:hypothetical protein
MTAGMSDRAETLLVNYWYAHPVGHAIEGLRYALGYHAANPELRVSLLRSTRVAASPSCQPICCMLSLRERGRLTTSCMSRPRS